MRTETEYPRYIVVICSYYEDSGSKSGCSERSLVRPVLENKKSMNYEDGVIVNVVIIEIKLLLLLYSLSTLDLNFYIYVA